MKKLLTAAALAATLMSSNVSAMSKTADTGYTETKYPIVLVHGFLGWDTMVGIDYWYKITETLQDGGADVHVITVPNANTPEVRGEELLKGLIIQGAHVTWREGLKRWHRLEEVDEGLGVLLAREPDLEGAHLLKAKMSAPACALERAWREVKRVAQRERS